jgi:predicted glycosyltransferase involved in capsule biosynthesis
MDSMSKPGAAPCLSVAVPVDLLRRPRDLLDRVTRLVGHPGMEKMEIVVAHNHRGTRHDRLLVTRLRELAHVTLVSSAFYDGSPNSGYLRNRAVERAGAATTLLLDADIYPDPDLFLLCARQIFDLQTKMVVLPCLYLTKWASRRLCRGKETKSTVLDAYFAFRRQCFQHMANPSSVMVFRTEDYWHAGGFDERFEGHGYEDFDFMLRLALHHDLIARTDELLENRSYAAPLLAVGFRKHLGRLSLPYLLEKKIVFHLHHEKEPAERYYLARKENAERLLGKLGKLVLRPKLNSSGNEFLVEDFFSLCRKKGIAARDYLVLFDTRPGHVDRMNCLTDRVKFVLGLN